MSFFDSILRFSYSRDLHQHLKGLSLDCESYGRNSVYQVVSLVLVIVSFLVTLNYYYGVFNHPKHARLWVWLLNIIVTSGIIGTIAYFMAASGLPAEKHCKDINFTTMDCILFAVTVAVYTFLACSIFSLFLKWKSVANKKVPF